MKKELIIMTITALLVGGCATIGMRGTFDKDGLPKQQYFVGSLGVEFNYCPLREGHIYIVEENTRKLLMTQSVDKEHSFDFSNRDIDNLDAKQLESLGINPSNMRLGIYFVPLEVMRTEEIAQQ